MEIKVLGAHNCEAGHLKIATLLIDSTLVIDAGGLTSSLSLPELLKLEAVLLTHQHYDHIKDIPALAMNLFLNNRRIELYSVLPVYHALASHLLNGELYPRFLEPTQTAPPIIFKVIEPEETITIADYRILPVLVNHSRPTVGYQVTAINDSSVFYTSDTGPGLTECWRQVSPQLLIIEVTAPNRYQEFARESGHLTPELLQAELFNFQQVKGYLPQVLVVHMNPWLEPEIESEIAAVAQALGNPVRLAREGMKLHL